MRKRDYKEPQGMRLNEIAKTITEIYDEEKPDVMSNNKENHKPESIMSNDKANQKPESLLSNGKANQEPQGMMINEIIV